MTFKIGDTATLISSFDPGGEEGNTIPLTTTAWEATTDYFVYFVVDLKRGKIHEHERHAGPVWKENPSADALLAKQLLLWTD